ncbi:NRDE family protein [Paraburkholderia phosphatilytica]|uniref:NRDE family protein n=1 Tax=Paraburkholderia phosphatilytica TaxID=2282883 RepID=UPI000E53AB35|nr:NRDE family protein [Paraburkholderia phosphatilytica]
MCLIVFDWRPDADDGALFTLTANRDEFLRRTAMPMAWWGDAPDLLAGRDLVGGGTWLGITRDGRFAALTNYRAPSEFRADAPTRGTLVSAWLTGEWLSGEWLDGGSSDSKRELIRSATPLDYLRHVARTGDVYNGFNLIVGDWRRRELGWYCNRSAAAPALLAAGTHGISNAVLDTPWPKLVRKRAELGALVGDGGQPPLDELVKLMRDPQLARDDELPATGISLERERALSAAFIDTPDYGTRGTTALRVIARDGRLAVEAVERSDDNGSHRLARPGHFETRYAFDVANA